MHIILVAGLTLYVLYVVCKAFNKRDRQIQNLENARMEALCAAIREATSTQAEPSLQARIIPFPSKTKYGRDWEQDK